MTETTPNIWAGSPVWVEERSCWQFWHPSRNSHPAYAESPDGLNWERIPLEPITVNGSEPDKSFPIDLLYYNVLRDELEEDPQKRYKGITRVGRHLISMVSPDSKNWTIVEGDKIPSGDQFKLSYDGIIRRFIATVKLNGKAGEGNYPVGEFSRAVSLSESEDMVHWTEPELVFWADDVDVDLGKMRMEDAIQNPDRRIPEVIVHDHFYSDIYNMAVFDYEDIY
ncbi:MAG: hypothetical protein GX811_07425, partial [Lentisphaerae bacterium]|nr:hypothetical protein [Lentisphaerota bacterium]